MNLKVLLAACGIFLVAHADMASAEDASDWSGPYAGFTVGTAVTGETVYYYSGVSDDRYEAEGKGPASL